MLHLRHCFLAIVFLLLCKPSTHAQYDSIMSLTTSEYRGDTLYTQDLLVQNYYKGNLIFERTDIAIDREWDDFVMTTHFYDLDGKRIKSIRIEEDRYECEPEWVPENSHLTIAPLEGAFFTIYKDSGETEIPLIFEIPDSNDYLAKFCGRYYTKTTHYLPYMDVSTGLSFYDDDDTTHFVDSIFYNRYHDIIREVKYGDDKLGREYRYRYVYDEKGRVLEKIWGNLTPGAEFKNKSIFMYNGEQQLQVSSSYHHFAKQAKETCTKYFYDEKFNAYKYERFYGDSLMRTQYINNRNKNKTTGFTVTAAGDTTDFSKYHRKVSLNKNRKESWTYRSKASEKYKYTIVDTLRKKGGYYVEATSYRITKEQFDKKVRAKKKRNYVLYHVRRQFDKANRLVGKIDYTAYRGPFAYTYDYKIMH